MVDAPRINNIIEQCKESLLNAKSNREFAKTLTDSFSTYNCKFVLSTKNLLSKNEYAVAGFYRPEHDIVTILFHIGGRNALVNMQECEWVDFKFLISQTLQHELIHRYQYSCREVDYETLEEIDYRYFDNIDIKEEIKYLSDSDELDAYSHDIAMEIMYHYKNKNPLDVLRRIDKTRKIWSYNYYKKFFKKHDAELWNSIKKRLLKKVFTWLPYVTIYR